MTTSIEVVLTPTEAKRILSKAVLARDEVKRALDRGMLVIHPSSTSIFMLQELGLKPHAKGIWICGHVSPKGLCISREVIASRLHLAPMSDLERGGTYPFELIIRKGELVPLEDSALSRVFEQVTAEDVFVKGVNAIDPEGKVGVLLAGHTGGSIGAILNKQKEVGFKIIIPVGLEKRIPISLGQAMKAALEAKRAQGIPCGLWRLRGTILTEIEAFRQLCDVEAIPISAGGVCGAEGAIVWVLRGEERKVENAYRLCEQIHGHELPYKLDVFECEECPKANCNLAGKKWPPR